MHVVVVGAGVFGVWTAHYLVVRGASVTIVDAYGTATSRASSGDETRVIRCGYGPDAIYSRMARQSLQEWQALDDRLGAADPLFHPSGVLWMAAGNDTYTNATLATLIDEGAPVEALSPEDVRRRYPQFTTDGIEVALLEPEGGVIAARRAVRALARDLQARGVRFLAGRVEPPADTAMTSLRLADGSRVEGDRFVFACGAWLPHLFPPMLTGRIRPTRQVVVYFGPPSGESAFAARHLPVWIDFPSGIYGTPDIDGRGVKVGIDEHGRPIDPDHDDRMPDSASLERARTWLARRLPALARAPVVETRVCAYENTSNGDFLIDRHPAHDNVVLAGGGSGHGFKHGPAVGGIVARLVLENVAPDMRFSLETKATTSARAVY